ncbi:MAG: hypothetical protein O2944_03960 [Proteobacteria bacterium]|nr:hypothetical protein [Pseudomonadota bacterium]
MAKRGGITYPYGLRYKFSGSIQEIENWLENNCAGAFEYQLENIIETTGFSQLEVLFKFQHFDDKERFKTAIKSNSI